MHDARVNCCMLVVRKRVVASLQDYMMRWGNSRVANQEWGLSPEASQANDERGKEEEGENVCERTYSGTEARRKRGTSETGSLCSTTAYAGMKGRLLRRLPFSLRRLRIRCSRVKATAAMRELPAAFLSRGNTCKRREHVLSLSVQLVAPSILYLAGCDFFFSTEMIDNTGITT